MNTVAGTGHRPPRLGLKYDKASRLKLDAFATACLKEVQATKVLSGGAMGWDMSLAFAAYSLDIPFQLCLPFENFGSHWQSEYRDLLDFLKKKADNVHVVCEGPWTSSIDNWKYVERDRFMVDKANLVLALWDGKPKGGTYHTVDYASKSVVRVKNVWEAWKTWK